MSGAVDESLYFVSRIDLDGLRGDVAKIEQQLRGITSTAKGEAQKFDDTYKRLTQVVAGYFSLTFGAHLASSIIEVRGQFQQLDIAFTTMLGSKEKSSKLMAQTVELAAKTPYSLLEVAQVEKGLIAFGEDASNVADTMTRLGNISSGTGANIGELGQAYGKVMSKGKMQAEELNQFTERGVPIVAELAKMYGVTAAEVYKMVEQGKVGFPELQQVIKNVTDEGGMFYNLMEKQSTTLTGKISNLGDAIDNMYNDLAAGNDGIVGDSIDGLISLVNNYETVLKVLESMVVAYGAYKTALIVNSMTMKGLTIAENLHRIAMIAKEKALKLATIAQNAFNKAAMMNPLGLIIGGLVAATGALLIYGKSSKSVAESQDAAAGYTEEYSKKLTEQRAELEKNISIASNNYKSLEERNSALKRVKDSSNGYLNSLTLENLKTSEGTTLLKNYNEELERKIRSDALADKKTAIFKQKADLEIQNDKLNSAIVAVPTTEMQEISNKQNQLALKINQDLIAGLDTQIAKLDDIDKRLSAGPKGNDKDIPQTIADIDKKIKELRDAQLTSTIKSEYESYEAKIAVLEAKKEAITGKKADKEASKDEKDAAKTELDALKEELDNKKYFYKDDLAAYQQYLADKEALLFGSGKDDQLKAVHDAQKDNDREIAQNLADLAKKYETFEQQKKDVSARYAKERLTLIEAGKTEEIAQLDKAEKEELKNMETNHVKENASYQYLFESIDKLSVDALKKRIARLKQDLAMTATTAEEKLALEKGLAEASEALVSRAPMAALKELSARAKELKKQIKEAKTDEEKAPLQAELDGVTQKKGEALADVFGNVSSRLGEAKELAGMFSSSLGEAVGMASDLAGSFAQMASGNYIAGAIGIATTLAKVIVGNQGPSYAEREAAKTKVLTDAITETNAALERQIRLTELLQGLQKSAGYADAIQETADAFSKTTTDLENELKAFTSKINDTKAVLMNNFMKEKFTNILGTTDEGQKQLADIRALLNSKDFKDFTNADWTKVIDAAAGQEKERLQNLYDQWISLQQKQQEYFNTWAEGLTGTSYDSMVEAIASGFEDGNYSAEEFSKNFETLMKTAILNALKTQWIEEPMKEWNAHFADAMKDGVLTKEEADNLKAEMQTIKDNAAAGLEAINQAGIDLLGDTTDSAKGLSGAIQGMSQDSADLLAGQMGAIRIHVADIAAAITGSFNSDLKDAWKTPTDLLSNTLGVGIGNMSDSLMLMQETSARANDILLNIQNNTARLWNIEVLLSNLNSGGVSNGGGYNNSFREDRIMGR